MEEALTWLSSDAPLHAFSVEAAALPTKTVVVYADRAEVYGSRVSHGKEPDYGSFEQIDVEPA